MTNKTETTTTIERVQFTAITTKLTLTWTGDLDDEIQIRAEVESLPSVAFESTFPSHENFLVRATEIWALYKEDELRLSPVPR